MATLGEVWQQTLHNLLVASYIALFGTVGWGIVSWYRHRKVRNQHPEVRSRYMRLPLLVAGMGVSYAAVLHLPAWIYPVTGVVWAVSYPVRAAVSQGIIQHTWSTWQLTRRENWKMITVVLIPHALMWPLSIPVAYLSASEAGAFLDTPEDDM